MYRVIPTRHCALHLRKENAHKNHIPLAQTYIIMYTRKQRNIDGKRTLIKRMEGGGICLL